MQAYTYLYSTNQMRACNSNKSSGKRSGQFAKSPELYPVVKTWNSQSICPQCHLTCQELPTTKWKCQDLIEAWVFIEGGTYKRRIFAVWAASDLKVSNSVYMATLFQTLLYCRSKFCHESGRVELSKDLSAEVQDFCERIIGRSIDYKCETPLW